MLEADPARDLLAIGTLATHGESVPCRHDRFRQAFQLIGKEGLPVKSVETTPACTIQSSRSDHLSV